jgi:C-terminal processing protease CtpA/Prc
VAALGTEMTLTVGGFEYFAVVFGAEAIGMIITVEDGDVLVDELRDGPDGRLLAAKASRRIRTGDQIVAVNSRSLLPHRTLEHVSREFADACRPVRVLFRRPKEAV